MYSLLHITIVLILQVIDVSSFDCSSNSDKLQVHLVPHTHDDVGWLKTVDQYYYGSNSSIQNAGVQYILDSVVDSLQRDPTYKFIYVEMAFFKRWWDEQDEGMKSIVKKLVKTKQLEFINGGWSMNDEAATHYNAIIDQMTVGLRFINDTFGSDARPTVAWHIDPFGHSAEQASLFSQMSFDGFFLGRIDYADKFKREREQRLELLWRGSRNFGKATDIFTGILYNAYSPPSGFCYDENCADPPIQDDPNLFDMNVKERVDAFVKYTCKQAKHYQTNHILLTMGMDFYYQNAHRWYKNLDKLIRYVNKDGRVNVFYSTPSIYLKALHDAGKTWEVKTDDFFPYKHQPHSYWTGYFTSRPTHKGYIRESNNILQACKQVEALLGNVKIQSSSDFLRRSMAVNQHHDAATGTEKQHVANDYAKRLHMGRTDCQAVMSSFISHKYNGDNKPLDFQRCDYLNISVCQITETKDSIAVNIYNPLGWRTSTFIKVPVNSRKIVVTDSSGSPIESQISPVSKSTSDLRFDHKGFATYELTFPVLLPPLGLVTYHLQHVKGNRPIKNLPKLALTSHIDVNNDFIENDFLRLEFSLDSGRLVKIFDKRNKMDLNADQNFLVYEGNPGDKVNYQTSGAYIFRPINQEPYPVNKNGKIKIKILRGPLVSEVRQIFSPYVSQVIRLYRGKMYAEFEHTIGPIPVHDHVGREIITRFKTDIKNDKVYYTDANGREMKKRIRDYRETWKLNITREPVSQNYYPINSRIYINDTNAQLTVMSDRSQGGGSIQNGEVELMLHRRLLKDDFLGVGEALNETGSNGKGLVTRGIHRVFVSKPHEAPLLHREEGQQMLLEPIVSFSDTKQQFNPVHSALTRPLPKNVHLLTMETTNKKNELLLRLEHIFEKDEDPILSKPVTINLDNLFTDFNVVSMVELNLSANQLLKDKKMWKWNTDRKFDNVDVNNSSNNMEIHLNPMQIRTFLLSVRYK